MASDHIIHVGEQDFDAKVLQSAVPVVVDFWAEWCGPCRQIAPLLEEAAEKYQGQVQVAKLNVDDSPNIAVRFGVRGIPTLILYKGGEVVAQHVGMAPRGQIEALFQKAL
jgi:thioredoxin 1